MPNTGRMFTSHYRGNDRYSLPSIVQSQPNSGIETYRTNSYRRHPDNDDEFQSRGRKWPMIYDESASTHSMETIQRLPGVSMLPSQTNEHNETIGLPRLSTLLKRCQTEEDERFITRKRPRVENEPMIIPSFETNSRVEVSMPAPYEPFSRVTPLLQPIRRDSTQYASSNVFPLVCHRRTEVENPHHRMSTYEELSEEIKQKHSHAETLSSLTHSHHPSIPHPSPRMDTNRLSSPEESVIEAAADFVHERSPSQRESITKLLLKSKEFQKAKHLVRNRSGEIDWVATFLNVGFESNSIYALMCPLRKGRWKVEEEKYTMELLRLIQNGTIRLRHGQSIRSYIAKKLHSDDMRVLKKLSNCKMFHFVRMINPCMSNEEEFDLTIPDLKIKLQPLDKLKSEFLRSVQLEALVAVRKYLSDSSIRELLNG